MSDGWGLPMRDERPSGQPGPLKRWRLRRARRSEVSARDLMNGWWQNQGGEWLRDTPHGDWLDPLFDRLAEDYVKGDYPVSRLVAQLEAACDRFAQLIPGQRPSDTPFDAPRIEALP